MGPAWLALRLLLAPALVAGVGAFARGRVVGVGVALGWLTGWWLAMGLPPWPPVGTTHRLAVLVMPAVGLAVLGTTARRAALLAPMQVAAIVWMSWAMLGRQSVGMVALLLVGGLGLAGVVGGSIGARRLTAPLVPGAGAVCLGLTHSVSLAGAAVALAAAASAALLVSRERRAVALATWGILGGLLVAGVTVSDLPVGAAAMLMAAVASDRLQGWRGTVAAAVLVAGAVAVSVGVGGWPGGI